MTDGSASISPLRARVSTGYGRLDEALQGGFLAGSAVVLSAPASDEVPLLLRNFLKPTQGQGLLICRSLSAAQAISQAELDNLKVLVCSEAVPPSKNLIPGKGVENLTEVNLRISETLKASEPKIVALDILSEVLLRHKVLQTRKWLSEFLARLRSRGITTLAVINPYMHAKEDVEAIVDLFDGNLELFEQNVEGSLRKFLRSKMDARRGHNRERIPVNRPDRRPPNPNPAHTSSCGSRHSIQRTTLDHTSHQSYGGIG